HGEEIDRQRHADGEAKRDEASPQPVRLDQPGCQRCESRPEHLGIALEGVDESATQRSRRRLAEIEPEEAFHHLLQGEQERETSKGNEPRIVLGHCLPQRCKADAADHSCRREARRRGETHGGALAAANTAENCYRVAGGTAPVTGGTSIGTTSMPCSP